MFKRKTQIVFIFGVLSSVLWFSITGATPPINKDHSTHPPGKCHNLKFYLIIPESDFVDDMPVLRGRVPVKIEMHPKFKGFGRDDGYGVFISVDYKGVFEEDGIEFGQGNILDITYQLNTRNLNNGTHLINVNVIDYYDHSGSVLMKVIVDN